MNGDKTLHTARQCDQPSAIGIDGECLAHQPARRGGAKSDGDRRLNEIDLVVEPPAASVDLAYVGLLVEAPLAARLVLEVLHGVGDVDFIPLDAGRFERLVEHLAGGTDEG